MHPPSNPPPRADRPRHLSPADLHRAFLRALRRTNPDAYGSPEPADPFTEEVERAIECLDTQRSLGWIEEKAATLIYDTAFLLAATRILSHHGSTEQRSAEMTEGFFALMRARTTVNQQVRRLIYRLALKSGSIVFIEMARQKGLIGWIAHHRLKSRFVSQVEGIQIKRDSLSAT